MLLISKEYDYNTNIDFVFEVNERQANELYKFEMRAYCKYIEGMQISFIIFIYFSFYREYSGKYNNYTMT